MATEKDSSRPEFWEIRFSEGRTPWDAGGVPKELETYLAQAPRGGRALIPGCGAAYEAVAFHEAGYEVIAIDFSAAAVAAARRTLGPLQGIARLGDFFLYDFEGNSFDVIYERAFLCSLPRNLWSHYVTRVSELLQPGGVLVGFFFFDSKEGGPPFGLRQGELHDLLQGQFMIEADEQARGSVPIFAGRERWQQWRRLALSL